MPYVTRNVDGTLEGLFEQFQEGYAEEFLADGNPEVVAFSKRSEAALAASLPVEVINFACRWNMTASQAVMHIHKSATGERSSSALN